MAGARIFDRSRAINWTVLSSALLIVVAGAVVFLPYLGTVHLLDWDEINFAESAREMVASGNYARVQIDYQAFWEKPPLFFWLQAASMHAFGINEFAARVPNALAGIATLLTFFFIGTRLFDTRFGLLWALSMMGSVLPLVYFRSGIIDPVFNYLIFVGLVCLIASIAHRRDARGSTYALLSGVCVGLATLTKGPVALLIVLLSLGAYGIAGRFRRFISWQQGLQFTAAFVLITGMWVVIEVIDNGFGFPREFINYQVALFTQPVADHGGPLYYHFVTVFLGCFPLSVMAIPALISTRGEDTPVDFKQWMIVLFWVVMMVFTIVKTKIVHYTSLTYFPLSFLCAFVIHQSRSPRSLSRWVLIVVMALGSVLSLLLFAVPWLVQHPEFLIPYVEDPFAIACLSIPVAWNGTEQYIGVVYWLLVMTSVVMLWRRHVWRGSVLLFASTTLCTVVYVNTVVPKLESSTQGPAIHFYQSLQGQQVYVTTVGFKSYAQFFYFGKPPGDGASGRNREWLLRGAIDRPAYFVTKSTSMEAMRQYPDVHLLKQEGGFAFYIRKPQ